MPPTAVDGRRYVSVLTLAECWGVQALRRAGWTPARITDALDAFRRAREPTAASGSPRCLVAPRAPDAWYRTSDADPDCPTARWLPLGPTRAQIAPRRCFGPPRRAGVRYVGHGRRLTDAGRCGGVTVHSCERVSAMVSNRALLDQLETGLDHLLDPDNFKRWLTVQSRLPHYSFGNVLLIPSQRPDATGVAGFHAWKQLGRSVKKGEHGIMILAPMTYKTTVPAARREGDAESEAPTPVRFRVVYVFDISQTEGRRCRPWRCRACRAMMPPLLTCATHSCVWRPPRG